MCIRDRYEDALKICERFVFKKGERLRILSFKEDASRAMKILESRSNISPSTVYKTLEPLSFEVMILLMACARSRKALKRITDFFQKYNGMKTCVKGHDLKIMGLKPCPDYKKILDKILFAKIDGKVRTKTEEMKFAKEIVDAVCR